MAGKGALIQEANAVESLSNVDILCTDKTGTLTTNVIRLHDLEPLAAPRDELERLLTAYAASTAVPNRTIEALAAGLPGRALPVSDEAPFSSARKWSGLAFADGDLPYATLVLGAPEALAAGLRSDTSLGDRPAEWTAAGLRVLLLAGVRGAARFTPSGDVGRTAPTDGRAGPDDGAGPGRRQPALPADLVPLGLVSLADELRPEGAGDPARVRRGRDRGEGDLGRRPAHRGRAGHPGRAGRRAHRLFGRAARRPRRARVRRGGGPRRGLRPGLTAAEGGPHQRAPQARPLRGDDRRRRERRDRAQARRPGHRHGERQPREPRRRRPRAHGRLVRRAAGGLPRGPAHTQRHAGHPQHLRGADLLAGARHTVRRADRRLCLLAAPVRPAFVPHGHRADDRPHRLGAVGADDQGQDLPAARPVCRAGDRAAGHVRAGRLCPLLQDRRAHVSARSPRRDHPAGRPGGPAPGADRDDRPGRALRPAAAAVHRAAHHALGGRRPPARRPAAGDHGRRPVRGLSLHRLHARRSQPVRAPAAGHPRTDPADRDRRVVGLYRTGDLALASAGLRLRPAGGPSEAGSA